MKPSYATLKNNHYTSNSIKSGYVSGEALYKELGYDHAKLIKQDAGFVNTCATRMSLALLKSGVHFHGRMKIKAGKYKDRMFEPGAKLLADQLAKSHDFGKPQIYKGMDAPAKLAGKKGLVFFWKIADYNGGHIDVIESTTSIQVCNSGCYFNSKEVWFWPLD